MEDLGFGFFGVGDRGQSGLKGEEKAGDAQALCHQGIILSQRFNFGLFLRKTFATEWSSIRGHTPKPEIVKLRVEIHPFIQGFCRKWRLIYLFN